MFSRSTSVVPRLEPILLKHGDDAGQLLQILTDVQQACGYISPDAVSLIAAHLRIPLARVRGVASFYSFLKLAPHGEYQILFSDNVTDRMLGNQDLIAGMCRQLWLQPGKVSEDGLVSIGLTSCTGMCDQGPALLVNGRAITRMTHQRVREIGDLVRCRIPLEEWPAEYFVIEDNIRRAGPLLSNNYPPGEALRAALGMGEKEIVDAIKRSGLRGRGGAGFSTGLKWAACQQATGTEKFVVCNADEGEPGTFKDRVLLTRQADWVFEGMTVCALAIGAHKGYLYLRGEYRYLLEPLHEILQKRREAKLLGRDILGHTGFDFDIEIHLGAGAYVCGEESALIESLEGKRGVPRNRPPFPVTHGYRQQPTAVNNVETFCSAALALAMGVENYRAIGTEKSTGSKLIS